jgi:hypothetical protein
MTMRHSAVVVLGSAVLAACSPKGSAPRPEVEANLITDLRDGHADLSCVAACAEHWRAGLAGLNKLHAAQHWRDLATQVMWIGYQNDLAYYYLGRSAEGLGAPKAALIYYRKAGAVTARPDSQFKCNAGGHDACNGLSFPRDLYPRIQAVRNQIAGPHPTPDPGKPLPPQENPWIEPPTFPQ